MSAKMPAAASSAPAAEPFFFFPVILGFIAGVREARDRVVVCASRAEHRSLGNTALPPTTVATEVFRAGRQIGACQPPVRGDFRAAGADNIGSRPRPPPRTPARRHFVPLLS